jgi:hypothetical protein
MSRVTPQPLHLTPPHSASLHLTPTYHHPYLHQYVKLIGLEESKIEARRLVEDAVKALSPFGYVIG